MPEEMSKSLGVCIAVEAMTAEIYHAFSRLFPQVKDFWYDLALSEENHTNILLLAAGLHRAGTQTEDIAPRSLYQVQETFTLVSDSKKRVGTNNLSIKEAFEMALQIENSTGEIYFQQVITQQTDSEVILGLRELLVDEQLHNIKIQSFMKTHGL
jgi:rubrerythrin